MTMVRCRRPAYRHGVQVEQRERFASARVARLATVTPAGAPHLVPIVFAVEDETVWFAVDAKPKRSRRLQRLANIEANPTVSLLVDAYSEDWTRLWWVRADGRACVIDAGTPEEAAGLEALAAKYPQHLASPPPGPVVRVTVDRWSAWTGGTTLPP